MFCYDCVILFDLHPFYSFILYVVTGGEPFPITGTDIGVCSHSNPLHFNRLRRERLYTIITCYLYVNAFVIYVTLKIMQDVFESVMRYNLGKLH